MSIVFVYIYDLSKGLADQLSLALIGKHVSGIWHTSIVVYEKEIYFGSGGIDSCPPAGTVLAEPNEKVKLGYTNITYDELNNHLAELSKNIFNGSKYDLMHHNCNTFSNELSIWLTGRGIPEHITSLPRDILETPFGKMIKPFMDNYSPAVSVAYRSAATHYSQVREETDVMTATFYKEPLGPGVDLFLKNKKQSSEANFRDILKSMVSSIKKSTPSFIPEELIALLNSIDVPVTIVVLDILRLFVLKEIECVVLLFVNPIEWLRTFDQAPNNDELNNLKCKFLCNLIGKHFDAVSSNVDCLQIISKFALQCVRNAPTMRTASSLIRNLAINVSGLGDDLALDIGSVLIHIVAEDHTVPDKTTKENVIGSIYCLARHSEMVKEAARAHDLHRRVRRETVFCLQLYKELQ